jgi:hypothetical protein
VTIHQFHYKLTRPARGGTPAEVEYVSRPIGATLSVPDRFFLEQGEVPPLCIYVTFNPGDHIRLSQENTNENAA